MKGRRHWFRIAAVVVGLLVPASVEWVCRFFVEDLPSANGYVEYLGQRPLFVLDDDEQTYRVAENRRAYFAADSFPKATTSKTRRIFVLGGSTVQGRPFSVPTSFPTCLEVGLNAAVPEYDWDVVNCGGVSYASYRLLPILNEVIDYEPAAIVLCTGHNEFLEFMTYRDAVRAIDTFGESAVGWSNLASVRVLRSWFSSGTEREVQQSKQIVSKVLPTEVEALLDQADGWDTYRRDMIDRQRIQRQFQRNLRRFVAVCRERKIPLLMVSPVVNLRDCPPFKSEFDSLTSDADQQQFLKQLGMAARIAATDFQAAVAMLKELCAWQPQYALAWYELGWQLLNQGQVQAARDAFQKACDEDVCPLRMTSSLQFLFREVAADSAVELVDLNQFFEKESQQGLVGDNILVDHVHPSFTSHRKIGCLLVDHMLELLAISATQLEWRERAVEKLRTDFDALDGMYFLRGRRTLDNLDGWARGRAQGTELNPSADQ